jgi:hypothetical protein
MLGTERLFTMFPHNWRTVQRTDRGYRVAKIVWGTKIVDLHEEIGRSSLQDHGSADDSRGLRIPG